MEKPLGYHDEWSPSGGSAAKNRLFQTMSHDSPKTFPYNVILSSSRTSKMGFLSANGLPREYHGQYTDHEALYIARVKSHYTTEGCRKNVRCGVLTLGLLTKT